MSVRVCVCLPVRQLARASQPATVFVFQSLYSFRACLCVYCYTCRQRNLKQIEKQKKIKKYIYFLHLVIARRWCYLCRKIEIDFKRCLLCFHLEYNKKENIVAVIQQHFSHNKQHSVKIKCKWMEKILGISDRLIIMQFLKIPSNKCHQMKVVLLLLFLLLSPIVYIFFTSEYGFCFLLQI